MSHLRNLSVHIATLLCGIGQWPLATSHSGWAGAVGPLRHSHNRRMRLPGSRLLFGAHQQAAQQGQRRDHVHHTTWDPHNQPAPYLIIHDAEAVETGHGLVIRIYRSFGEGEGHAQQHVGWNHGQHIADPHPLGWFRVEARGGASYMPPEEQGRANKGDVLQPMHGCEAQGETVGIAVVPGEEDQHVQSPGAGR